MINPDVYLKAREFALHAQKDYGFGFSLTEYCGGKSDRSELIIAFTVAGAKICYAFSDTELNTCRLPVDEYVGRAMADLMQETISDADLTHARDVRV